MPVVGVGAAALSRSALVFSGSNDRAVLAFLRVLERCGQRPYIVAWTAADRVFRTRHRQHVAYTRDSNTLDMEHFAHYLHEVRKRAGNSELTILPSSEYLNTFLLRNRSDIEALGCHVPLADEATYFRLTNKESAAALFCEHEFAVPRQYHSALEAPYPLVAKPRKNVSSEGVLLYPRFLNSADDLSTFREHFNEADFFFQERVRGRSVYLLFYLAQSSSHVVAFSQRNLMQQPNGKSILMAVPADFHETGIASRALQMLRRIEFNGLGMIEFIRTAQATVFIEMNPRIWGPAQLCVDNRVPILEAFAGDMIHGDSHYFVRSPEATKIRPRRYAWLGGAAAAWSAGSRPVRLEPECTWRRFLLAGLRSDVYLRRDSWRCFFYELRKYGRGDFT